MARAPFARRFVNDYGSLRTDDDIAPLTRDSEQDCRSSSVSEVETSRNTSKSQENRPTCSSETPSTSDAARSTRSKKRRGLKPRIVEISVNRKDGRREEKRPLLRNHEENNNLNEVQVQTPIGQDRSANTMPKASSTERFCSVFIVFLLPFIGGLTLFISVYLKSDVPSRDITLAYYYYEVGLIAVFFLLILWLRCKKSKSERVQMNANFEPVIPSHLLNGLALFGVCNTAFKVILVLDWYKCSRSISGLSKSYPVSVVIEMLFVYTQLYVFYTLSRRRKQKLWFGSYFTMFTLAVNLTLWADYFLAGASHHPDMQNVTWFRHQYYGLDEDLCADLNNTGNYSRKLHRFVKGMKPFEYTFAMEYSLLASALLLHVWEIATSSPRELEQSAANGVEWDVWRFGFIAGLFSLPLMGSVSVLSTSKYNSSTTTAFYVVQAVLLFFICVCSVRGLWLLTKYYKRVRNVKALKVDLVLLCFSALGFLIVDLFTFFASVAEMLKSYHGYMLIFGLFSLGELVAIFSLTAFIFASYFYQLPLTLSKDAYQAVGMIRQIASFCITVSFGFWATRTYGFRSKYYFDVVGKEYFGTAWFVITLFSAPMCIFYHFHCAVCLSGIIADSTV